MNCGDDDNNKSSDNNHNNKKDRIDVSIRIRNIATRLVASFK